MAFAMKKNIKIFLAIFCVVAVMQVIRFAPQWGQPRVDAPDLPRVLTSQFSNVKQPYNIQTLPAITFLSPETKEISLKDFEGKYLLLNLWATWCAPCVRELPSLEKLDEALNNTNIEVISLSLDAMRNHDQVKAFLLNRDIGDFAAYYDYKGDAQAQIALRGIPTSFLLNPDGHILAVFEGDADWSKPEIIQFFKGLDFFEPVTSPL